MTTERNPLRCPHCDKNATVGRPVEPERDAAELWCSNGHVWFETREALQGAEVLDSRCDAVAHLTSGVYRCVYEAGHTRGVGPQQHYYEYYRNFTPDEVAIFKHAPSALPAPEAT